MEEQQNESLQQTLTQENKDRLAREKAHKQREIQALQLTCARIREQLQRSTNERYNELLKREIEHVEQQLNVLQG